MASSESKLNAQLFEAIGTSLACFSWYKRVFKRRVHYLLRGHPEILGQVDFNQTKRDSADQIVSILADDTAYSSLTLRVARELAAWDDFSDLRNHSDASDLLKVAKASTAKLRVLVDQIAEPTRHPFHRPGQERRLTNGNSNGSQEERGLLLAEFVKLQRSSQPQQRGAELENLVYRLANSEELDPRPGYVLPGEQIDGSLMLDGRCLLREEKWWADPVQRRHGDEFAAKLYRKGRGTIGMFTSVSGFSTGFKSVYAVGASFITLDGDDLLLILQGHIAFSVALRAKLRRLHETGNCFYPLNKHLTKR